MSRASDLISRLLFTWATPFIKHNAHTPLEQDGLLDLPAPDSAARDSAALRKRLDRSTSKGPGSLVRAMCAEYVPHLLGLFLLSLILVICGCLNPLLLREFILSLQGKMPETALSIGRVALAFGITGGKGYSLLCTGFLFISTVIQVLAIHHMFFRQGCLALRVKLSLSRLVYQKALLLHREERSEVPAGFIINLVSTDSFKVYWYVAFLHSTWVHPITIITVIFLLFQLVGIPAVGGLLVLVALLSFSTTVSGRQSALRRSLSAVADERVGFVNQILQHIKAVKFQGWEGQLIHRISKLRTREVSHARKLTFLLALSSFTSASAPALAMFVTFSLAVLQGERLDAAVIFPTLALLMMLRFALASLPDTIFNAVEAWVGLSRIQSFLNRKEYSVHGDNTGTPGALQVCDARFEWFRDKQAIYVPRLTLEPGDLIAVVGTVGAGKSALLLGLLGELSLASGSVSISGSIAYVGQQPWISSDSIRNNILCGRTSEESRYERAVAASGLEIDLAALPSGDRTEIGERGINLSGGQRQRVALARALYQDADVYLLDDPLSALDPAVANLVFDQLILKELSSKTCILVTHRLEYALRANRVVVIDSGQIIEDGTPTELNRGNSRFATLIKYHAQSVGSFESQPNPPSLDIPIASVIETTQEPSLVTERIVMEEERDRGVVNLDTVRTYAKRFIPAWGIVVLIALFSSRYIASVTADLWLASFSESSTLSVPQYLGIYVALIGVLCILNFSRSLFVLYRGLAAGVACHAALLQGVLRAPLKFFESNPVGRILNRFSRDLETIETQLPRVLLDLLNCLFEVLTLVIMIGILQPLTLLLLSPIAYCYYRLQRLFRPTSREAQRLDSITRSPVLGLLSESLAGVDTIRASSLTKAFDRRFCDYLNAHGKAGYSLLCANRWLGVRLEVLGTLIILFGGAGAAMSYSQTTVPIATGLMLTYALNITSALNWLVRCLCQLESNLTSFERIEHYSHIPSERLEGAATPSGWPSNGDLRLTNVSLRYRDHLPLALKSISCHIGAGERIGIVGRTGSGKSTLVLGLLRLLEPCTGTIELDGIDLATVPLDIVRHAITVVPQEPVLFSGTLLENIDPFGVHSETKILEACTRVELDSFIQSLPLGLNASVQESGSNFSSGQRQLLCLARALLENSRVIVMDEATAHIDVETDFAIQRALRREFKHATLLVIAHRLGTVLDSDHIMLLQNGELKEYAKPQELLRRSSSLFAAMMREVKEEVG